MLLAIDTSGPDCSVCLLSKDGRSFVAKISETLGRGHAERLMPMLSELLNQADCTWSDLSQIACTIGPGSFTGLRVGLATARGLALATGLPATGVGVLEAMARPFEETIAVAMDAKRGEVWLAAFGPRPSKDDGLNRPVLLAPAAQSFETASQIVQQNDWPLIGSGVDHLGSVPDTLKPPKANPVSPDIEDVARLGWAHLHNNQALPLSALYLRAPDAKPQASLLQARAAVSPDIGG